jgi:anaerobic magnesium-protoporphyrin IX monomethyl ester cyclase
MYGKRWRARSVASVMAEIEELYYKYAYRAIAFSDDNFTVSPQRVKDLCSMIIERGLDIWWWCLSSPKALLRNEDMVRLMAKAGAKTVYIGVESANPATLKEFNKETTHDTPFETVNLLKRNGIETFASYILGGLTDDVKTIRETIKLARRLDTAVAQFTILTPYPGTHLYNEMRDILRHRKWHLYDALHLVFKHKKVSFVTMEMLLLWAYISYYARSWHAFKGFLRSFFKNTPFLRKYLLGKPD